MDIRDLKIYLSVYQQQSFSKAAEINFVTQPVVGRVITALENEYGSIFFRRTKKGVFPTDDGILFAEYARKFISLYTDSLSALKEKKSHQTSHALSIAAVFPVTGLSLSSSISQLYNVYSDLELCLDRFTPSEMLQLLNSDHYDFYITQEADLKSIPDMTVKPLASDKLCLLTRNSCAPKNDKEAAETIREENVLILNQKRSPHLYSAIMEQLHLLNIEQKELREIRTLDALSYCVLAGMGCAISPDIPQPSDRELSIYKFKNGPTLTLAIGWRTLTPTMSAFLSFLTK